MKSIIFLIITLGITTSCQISKQSNKTLLNDIWTLETLEGKTISIDPELERPVIEFNLTEKRFTGTNGCNNIFGKIREVTDSKLTLEDIASTRMMCPNMELPDKFNQLFKDIQSYKIENMKLTLYKDKNKELMQFKKVD